MRNHHERQSTFSIPFYLGLLRNVLTAFGILSLAGVSGNLSALADDRWRPSEPSSPSEWYGQTIRESQWRSPKDELAGFHVPDEFQVELVAAEPDIAKPLNLAFDSKGRLWVTQSVQYPFPAKEGEVARDSIVVLEDRDQDGDYESKHIFADGLNIPIGILPLDDGVLAFSIPNIWRLQDTNGDGVCDKREVVIGPFDTSRDTHGMVNSLRDGGDGWIYACHGFNNISKIAGTDGHTIELTSGNTFRFRADGSRVEQYTQGQVNPFGMTRDMYGNWFTADCHSKPITQLLRGGCYPSFGRPDDGLGFLPPMMEHLHGSTAISGLAHVHGPVFPDAFQGDLLSGNVMTCRINRNRVAYHGATAKAFEMPDLLTSEDPWFRPVDLQFGPDGCLYVADFYNKIIGHYEVPLDHPDRDRTSGRIWRVRWKNKATADNAKQVWPILPARTKVIEGVPQALTLLSRTFDPADTVAALERLHTVEYLGEHASIDAVGPLMASMKTVDETLDPMLKQSHWIAMRDIMARHAKSGPPFPASLLVAANVSQRAQDLLKILRAIRDPIAASWSLAIVETAGDRLPDGWKTPWLADAVLQTAPRVPEQDLPRVLDALTKLLPDSRSRVDQVLVIAEAQKARNGRLSPKLVELGDSAIAELLQPWIEVPASDSTRAIPTLHTWAAKGAVNKDNREWPTESRQLDLGPNLAPKTLPVWSSIGLSERYTGAWTSSAFKAPETLEFWIVGHNGAPSEPDSQKNFVRLMVQNPTTRDWTERHRFYPPRSDIGKKVSVDLSQSRDATMRLEVVDGDGHDSFAWIAIGEISEPGLARGSMRDELERLLRMVRCFGSAITSQNSQTNASQTMRSWDRLFQSPRLDVSCKAALQKAMFGNEVPVASELVDCVVGRGWEDLLSATPTVKNQESGADERLPAYTWSWSKLAPETLEWIATNYCRRANAADQEELALRWSRHRASIPVMERLMRGGAMSKEVLRTFPAAWWEGLSSEDTARLADLKPEGESDTSRSTVVASKAAAVHATTADLAVGARVFQERCAACHQLAGQGKVIGPQLDGAITRTVERLCEDILWPNRNVDEAFRITNVLLSGGETVSGLVLDRQDDTLEIVDPLGKSQRIARDEIEAEKISKLSLMPGSFEELLSDAELASLIGYLKSHTPKP